MFVALPAALLFILALNFVWEVVRANVSLPEREAWPFRFVLLDRSATAALLGVFASLFIARSQWAKAHRPSIGYAIVDPDGGFDARKDRWCVWISNGGPGMAIVDSFKYIVKFTNQPRSVPVSLAELDQYLEHLGLSSGKHYFIRELGAGALLPAVVKHADGSLVCWFTTEALAALDEFDIDVRLSDALGDVHERTLTIMDKLPRPALIAKRDFIAKTQPGPPAGAP
ncbi:hypothetical protein ACWCHM_23020 [Micromonospora sp. SCSIO 07396]